MNRTATLAIVILNWNGKNYLAQFLPAVLSSCGPHARVVVADNGSTDGSLSFLQSDFPEVETIIFTQNYGFAKGYNEALKRITANYYVLLNSDVLVTDNWLAPMLKLLDSNPNIAACQPKILSYNNKKMFEYAGAAGGWIDEYGYPFSKGRVFEVCEEDKGQYDVEEPIFWASGAALFIRSNVFHKVGGFDEFFFAHQEEIDLCWRIQLEGYKIYSCPSSTVFHIGGGTLPRGNSLKTFLNFRNNLIMLYKNLSFIKRLYVLFTRTILDTISAVKGLITGDAGYFVAIFRAHFAFIGWFLFHRKKSLFPQNKTLKPDGYLTKNMVWQHFVKKKKYFHEIVDSQS